MDRALQSAPWNRKIQKDWNFSHGCGNRYTLARDITGERFGQCSPGDEFYPLLLMLFAVLGVGTCVYGIASYVGILHEKCQIPESKVELDEAKAARCVSKRMTGSEKIDAGKSLGIKSCEKNTESEKTGAPGPAVTGVWQQD